jgi:hypothetical protein
VDASAVLASAEDRVIDEAVAALAHSDQARQSSIPDGRREVRQLLRLVLRCMRASRAEPIIRPSELIAAHCYAAGIDLAEVQRSLTVLAEVLWHQLADALAGEQLVQALGLLTAITGAGKDAIARNYVALATRDRNDEQSADEPAAAGAGSGNLPRGVVQTDVVGQVGMITLGDRGNRNAIGAEMASRVIAALQSLSARQVRAIVLRAAPGCLTQGPGQLFLPLLRVRAMAPMAGATVSHSPIVTTMAVI